MKLLIENNTKLACILIAGISLPAFSFLKRTPIDNKITGTWRYISVQTSGKNIFEIGNNDTLLLHKNGQFAYFIESPKKQAAGHYTLINTSKDSSRIKKALQFTYIDGKVRTFYICSLKQNDLCIREGATKFTYKRKIQ